MGSALRRLDRDAEATGHLVRRKPLDVAQQDGIAVGLWQPGNDLRQGHAQGWVNDERVGCGSECLDIDLDLPRGARPAGTGIAKACAANDLEQPARECGCSSKAAEFAIENPQGILHCFFDIVGFAVSPGVAFEVRSARGQQPVERHRVASMRAIDQNGTRVHLARASSLRPASAHIGQKPTTAVSAATAALAPKM